MTDAINHFVLPEEAACVFVPLLILDDMDTIPVIQQNLPPRKTPQENAVPQVAMN